MVQPTDKVDKQTHNLKLVPRISESGYHLQRPLKTWFLGIGATRQLRDVGTWMTKIEIGINWIIKLGIPIKRHNM